MVTLHWTPQAVEDLHAIFEHISHDSNIRELIYKNYRIVYYVHNKELIRILTVFHSSKNFDDTQLPE